MIEIFSLFLVFAYTQLGTMPKDLKGHYPYPVIVMFNWFIETKPGSRGEKSFSAIRDMVSMFAAC